MRQPITMRSEWRAQDLGHDSKWCRLLTKEEVADIESALRHAKATAKPMLGMTKEDFPLAAAGAALQGVAEATEDGRGFQLLRGFPVERYDADDARLIFWGLGMHMGVPRPQGKASTMLADVRDQGTDYRALTGRGYTSKAALDYHSDFCDIVGLMCLKTAKAGGESRIASAVAVHNEILRRRPDLLEILYQPFYYSRQGEEAPDEAPYYRAPIYSTEDGFFSSRYTRNHIRSTQRMEDLPKLTEDQTAALDLLDEVAASEEFSFAMDFEPGDMQFINNHVIYHARTDYEDHEEPNRKRHLLRLWLAVHWSRPLTAAVKEAWHDVAPGSVRGGIRGQAYGREIREFEVRAARALGMPAPTAVSREAVHP